MPYYRHKILLVLILNAFIIFLTLSGCNGLLQPSTPHSTPTPDQEEQLALEVSVLNENSQPIPGADIVIKTENDDILQSKTSDQNGMVLFDQLDKSIKGSIIISASALSSTQPYTFWETNTTLSQSTVNKITITGYDMRPHGTIVDKNTNLPKEGIVVTLMQKISTGVSIIEKVTSDVNGLFTFSKQIPEGIHSISLEQPGTSYNPVIMPVTISRKSTDLKTIQFESFSIDDDWNIPLSQMFPAPFIYIKDGNGTLIQNGSVICEIKDLDGNTLSLSEEIVNNKSGMVFIKALMDYNYIYNKRYSLIYKLPEGYNEKAYTIFNIKEKHFFGIMRNMGDITIYPIKPAGSILAEDGTTPVTDAVITLVPEDNSTPLTYTPNNSSFIWPSPVAEGNYTVKITSPNHTYAPFVLQVRKDIFNSWDMRIISALKVVDMKPYAKVVDHNNTAIENAVITLTNTANSSLYYSAQTTANGTCKFSTAVSEGNYTVSVQKPPYTFPTFTVTISAEYLSLGVIKPND